MEGLGSPPPDSRNPMREFLPRHRLRWTRAGDELAQPDEGVPPPTPSAVVGEVRWGRPESLYAELVPFHHLLDPAEDHRAEVASYRPSI
jgi:hypothetical protein